MTDPTITPPRLVLHLGVVADSSDPCALCDNNVDGPWSDLGVATHDGPRVCQTCTDEHEPGLWELALGLGWIDIALQRANPESRPHQVGIAEEALSIFGENYQVAEQAGIDQAGHDDLAFAIKVAERAMITGRSPDDAVSLVGALCPDLPTAEFMQAMQEHAMAAAGREADAEAEIPMLQCAQLVLGRAPGPTLGEAVDQLGIDFDQFVGIVTAQAAAAGVDVENLPADVITECLAAAKTEKGTTS